MDEFIKRQKKYNELRKECDEKISETNLLIKNQEQKNLSVITSINNDNKRVLNVIDKAPAILHDIHTQFEKATKLSGKDYAFLFGAAALQTARWALLPELNWDFKKLPDEKRLLACEGGKLERENIIKFLRKEGINNEQIAKVMKHTHIKIMI